MTLHNIAAQTRTERTLHNALARSFVMSNRMTLTARDYVKYVFNIMQAALLNIMQGQNSACERAGEAANA